MNFPLNREQGGLFPEGGTESSLGATWPAPSGGEAQTSLCALHPPTRQAHAPTLTHSGGSRGADGAPRNHTPKWPLG